MDWHAFWSAYFSVVIVPYLISLVAWGFIYGLARGYNARRSGNKDGAALIAVNFALGIVAFQLALDTVGVVTQRISNSTYLGVRMGAMTIVLVFCGAVLAGVASIHRWYAE